MDYVFPPRQPAYLPIANSQMVFPVHRIYCVGRNYAAHAIEMGHDPDREPPFFFQKNPDNLVINGAAFAYPDKSSDVHHEIELVVALSKGGKDIELEKANECIWGYCVGLDMTRRDLQGQQKKMGRPWEIGKAFEQSAPCSPLVAATDTGHPQTGAIWLDINGERRQEGDLDQLIWKVAETISYLSGLFELADGDIIMTGTPSGVGPVQKGDVLHGHIEGIGDLHTVVT